MFIAELLTILKTTQATSDRWMDENEIHIHSGVLFLIKKGKSYHCNVDDLEDTVLSEASQTGEEKRTHDITCTWDHKKKKKKLNRKTSLRRRRSSVVEIGTG